LLWWQSELVEWYRRTCLAAGAGMAASAWHQASGAAAKKEVFEPPRAAALPPAVVEQWKRNVRFREAVRVVGKQTMVAAGVAALYFGAEAGVRVARAEGGAAAGAGAAAARGEQQQQREGSSSSSALMLPQVVGRTDGVSSGVAGMLSGAALGRIRESLVFVGAAGPGAALARSFAHPLLFCPLQKHPLNNNQTVPSPSPGRTTLSGALVGGVLGYASGWAQAAVAASALGGASGGSSASSSLGS
jgi:hypothetical protein